MYFLPNYVEFHEEGGAFYITSKLRQNTVKLFDPEIKEEFRTIVRCGGSSEISTALTKFLHDQELLVNEKELSQTLDELYSLLDSSLLITIMPTEGCNFRCPYCYEDHKPVSMSRKILDRVQEYIAEQVPNFRHLNIAWFGGEPTLCRDTIMETSQLIQALKQLYTLDYTASMTTNGYLLGVDHFKEYFRAGITSYQVTLDGWNHDKTRPHVSGKGTLDKIMENLTAISALDPKQYPFKITLRHNILPGDEDYSWYDHLYSLFGQDPRFAVLVRPVCDWGGDSVQSMSLLRGNQVEALLTKHVSYLHDIGMQCENVRSGPLSQVCYASYPHSMVFRSDGKIEKCTVCLDHPKNLIGYVDAAKGVVLDEQANKLWTDTKLKSECYHCVDVLACLNRHCRKAEIIDGDIKCSRI